VGNENGRAGETNWNTITPDTLFAGQSDINGLLNAGSENGTHWIPAETDVSIRPGWFYHAKEDSLVKTPEQLVEIYLTSVGRGSTLLLNVPPDKRGLFHEQDVKALRGFRTLLDHEFKTNFALNSGVEASSYRGNSKKYSPENLTDGNKETYWTTDDSVTTASLVMHLEKPQSVKYILLKEYIQLGQRIKSFHIEIEREGVWKKVAEATTIGYKRILKIEPVLTNKIRISITSTKACPIISDVEIY
jgi:alpha-L-fucosidase